jgi:hypothetical protein
MQETSLPPSAASLFSHVTAEKTAVYRVIMEVFATAKRQFRLHLRPDEVLLEAHWPAERPALWRPWQTFCWMISGGQHCDAHRSDLGDGERMHRTSGLISAAPPRLSRVRMPGRPIDNKTNCPATSQLCRIS